MQNLDVTGQNIFPVIDFNFALNTDLGLIRYIRENYQDERAFRLDILNRSDRELLSLLSSRTNINPLSIISVDQNAENIDSLYESFISNVYTDMINLSSYDVSIRKFVQMMIKYGLSMIGSTPIISISNDIERDAIVKFCDCKSNDVVYVDTNTLLSKDVFYVKDYSFFVKYNLCDKLVGKTIYIQPLQYSLDYFGSEQGKYLTLNNKIILFGEDHRKTKEKVDE